VILKLAFVKLREARQRKLGGDEEGVGERKQHARYQADGKIERGHGLQ
jgi:hypothetical protein